MNIALCYENVDPSRGGCETYIADLTRRLVHDGHDVHLYAARWNAAALPIGLAIHPVPSPRGLRFLRPWRFGNACLNALNHQHHDVTIGFDKTWGLDIHYPQGGIYAASQQASLRKHALRATRAVAALAKTFDPAVQSFRALERRQLRCGPVLLVNSEMVRSHAIHYYGADQSDIHVLRAAVDPARFAGVDRDQLRRETRRAWRLGADEIVGLFIAMNYRLKGLEPLLRSLCHVPRERQFRLVVIGHPRYDRFRRLAEHLGVADRVIFHGFCSDARDVYFAGDFLVHPTFYDPCSLVALEALACGLPVVTSRYNGACELLDPPRDGIIIDDPHDQRSLAHAMDCFLDRDRLESASRCALQAATRWTFDDHYRKMTAILEGVATRKRVVASAARAA